MFLGLGYSADIFCLYMLLHTLPSSSTPFNEVAFLSIRCHDHILMLISVRSLLTHLRSHWICVLHLLHLSSLACVVLTTVFPTGPYARVMGLFSIWKKIQTILVIRYTNYGIFGAFCVMRVGWGHSQKFKQ